jgi:hypothetical protein
VAVYVDSIITIECSVVRGMVCGAVLGCGCSVLFYQLNVRDVCSKGGECLFVDYSTLLTTEHSIVTIENTSNVNTTNVFTHP